VAVGAECWHWNHHRRHRCAWLPLLVVHRDLLAGCKCMPRPERSTIR